MNVSPLVRGAAKVAMFSAAFAIPGTGMAYAGTTTGADSVGGGNQINAPVSVPVNVCGNAVAVLFGIADAGCRGGASVSNHEEGSSDRWSTSGKGSVLGGNQINAPVSVPVNVCGNSAAVLGIATAKCKGGASVKLDSKYSQDPSLSTNGEGSVLGGNQVNVPVSIPVNVCGNAIALLGIADAKCKGGASVSGGDDSSLKTNGKHSVLGGNQVNAPVSIPVNVCGNAVNAKAKCKGGASVSGGDGPDMSTSGKHSVLGGNQVNAPVSIPVNVCGNAAAVVGIAKAKCKGGASVSGGDHSSLSTNGEGSFGGGNQVNVPVTAPVNVCGNAAAVIGIATAKCKGGASVGHPPNHGQNPPPWKKHHGHKPPTWKHHHDGNTTSSGNHQSHQKTTLTSSSSSLLPTTGADLAGLLAIALGAIAAGAVSLFAMRRRRFAGRA